MEVLPISHPICSGVGALNVQLQAIIKDSKKKKWFSAECPLPSRIWHPIECNTEAYSVIYSEQKQQKSWVRLLYHINAWEGEVDSAGEVEIRLKIGKQCSAGNVGNIITPFHTLLKLEMLWTIELLYYFSNGSSRAGEISILHITIEQHTGETRKRCSRWSEAGLKQDWGKAGTNKQMFRTHLVSLHIFDYNDLALRCGRPVFT